MMRQFLLFALLLATASAEGQTDKPAPRIFQAVADCGGRRLLMTFRVQNDKKSRCSVGEGVYGKPAIDTTTTGRIVLPDSVTDADGRRWQLWSLQRQAFAGCRHITEVVMPAGLEEIGDQAFYDCQQLREVTLPERLHVIYPFAFRMCTRLCVVRVKCVSRPPVYDNIFDQHTLDTATLIVPAGTAVEYANSLVFGMFRYRMEEF